MKQKNLMLIRLVSYHYKTISLVLLLLLFLIPVSSTVSINAQTVSLEQCIDTALLYNRSLLLSSKDILLADEKKKEMTGNLLPRLNASADYRYYTDLPYQLMPASVFGGPEGTYKEVQFGVPQSLNANLQLTVPLYSPLALGAIKTTGIASDLSKLQKIKTEEDVVLEVSNAYYNAQILLNQVAFLDSNLINTRKLVQTTALLYQQQLVKGTDVDRLRLQQEQLTTQQTTVSSQYRQVLNALKFLMGKPISDSIEVELSEETIVKADFKYHATTDIRLIDKKIEFTISELKGLKNSRLPSLSAYGVYGTTGFGTTGANSFFNFYPIGFVGAQLSFPLFNGTITQHKVVQKKIEIEKDNIQKEQVTEKSKLDIINAEMQYSLASRTIVTVDSQIKLAGTIYENTVLQNQQGIASITDLLLADSALREAQQNYIVALINLRKAELEYKRVSGNLITINN